MKMVIHYFISALKPRYEVCISFGSEAKSASFDPMTGEQGKAALRNVMQIDKFINMSQLFRIFNYSKNIFSI